VSVVIYSPATTKIATGGAFYDALKIWDAKKKKKDRQPAFHNQTLFTRFSCIIF